MLIRGFVHHVALQHTQFIPFCAICHLLSSFLLIAASAPYGQPPQQG
jgi:hypothetical protein